MPAQHNTLGEELAARIVNQHLYKMGEIESEVNSTVFDVGLDSTLDLTEDSMFQNIIGALLIPAGTDAERPEAIPTTTTAYLRYNTEQGSLEVGYNDGGSLSWVLMAS